MVQGDGLDDHADRAVDGGGREARAQDGGRVARVRRAGDDEPGDVTEHREPVVVVEVAAEALLIGQPRHPDDERIAVRAAGEELQGGRLAAQLVLGVVQVREVLDLGHGQQAGDAGAEREPEDGLLVEEGVDDPGSAEPALQSARDAVDAALAAHVLAEQQEAGLDGGDVGEGPVDRLRQGQPALVLRQLRAVHPAPLVLRRGTGGTLRDGGRRPRRQRRHHLLRGPEPGVPDRLADRDDDLVADEFPPAAHLLRREQPVRDDGPQGRGQRITLELGGDVRGLPVGGLEVGPGVAADARARQVEQDRHAVLARVVGRGPGGGERRQRVPPLVAPVLQAAAPGVHGCDPPGWRRHGDAQSVVLADEEQRHGDTLTRAPAGGVDSAGRRGVVRRRVPEAGHDEGVVRPAQRRPQPGGQPLLAADRPGDAQRAGQVAGDRRRLRDHREVRVSEDLVPAARDGLVPGGGEAEGHVEDAGARSPAGLPAAREVEAAGAVVQQGGVGGPGRQRHGGVRLVTGRPDRVEALVRRPQPPGRDVQPAAGELGVQQRQELRGVRVGVRPLAGAVLRGPAVGVRRGVGRCRQVVEHGAQVCDELLPRTGAVEVDVEPARRPLSGRRDRHRSRSPWGAPRPPTHPCPRRG